MRVTYVIYSHLNKAVKVGYASDLASRISSIQLATAEKLSLLFTFQGGRDTELFLHKLLADYRIRGEWFIYNRQVVDILLSYQQQQLELLTFDDVTHRDKSLSLQIENICKSYLEESKTRKRTRVPLKFLRSTVQLPLAQIKAIMLENHYTMKKDKNNMVYFYKTD